jgi:signal transduction histidine kinase
MSLLSRGLERLPRERSLYQQIKLARIWLPLAIVGVVFTHQLLIVPLGGDVWRFWAQLLFYSILGPVVTYATLDWIAGQVQERERTQNELRRLFLELQEGHALLGALQKVTEQYASATDLETALSAATEGIASVTGAEGVAIFLGGSDHGVTHAFRLTSGMARDALGRDRALQHGETLVERSEQHWVLSMPLVWGSKTEGSVHAYYRQSPSPEQREAFRILASEFSAAAEATRSRTRDLLTLFEVDRSIRAEGNLERLLETLLTQMMLRADATLGGVYLADEDGLLHLKAWHGLGKTVSYAAYRSGEGFVGRAAAQAEPCIENRLMEQERLESGPILGQAQSAVGLPLMTEQELLGVVILAHEDPAHFDETNLPFLSLLAGQVSLAVRNARAYLHSEELAIAEERARIASEIHDGVAQSLAFTALKLDLVVRLFDNQTEKAKEELGVAKNTIREMIREIRRSIFALRPIELERHGFIETIRRYARDYGQQNDIRVDLLIEETPQLSFKSEAVLFRIFQEAMHNVAKHAHARQVRIHVGKTFEDHVFITVEDDGQGFDPETVSDRVTSAGGLGLRQMRERLEARGGCFSITSALAEGTRVYASLPE